MTQTFYITTPIYYVNDVPHLGHAYTTLVADTLARFHRMHGDDTRFLTGTDEHGQKVEEAAAKRGLTPQQLVDEVAPRVVASLWKKIRQNNPDDLYLASYQGWYCVFNDASNTESQLDKNNCPIHKT